MNTVRKDILRCMTDLAGADNVLSARFVFPEDFIGFQGHFPSKKILPGICQVQCVLSMIEQHEKRAVSLKEIVQAKFFSPVSPSDEIACVCRDVKTGGGDFIVKALTSRGDQKISELKLRVCYAGGNEDR